VVAVAAAIVAEVVAVVVDADAAVGVAAIN
jgi:hypothetical protein